MTNEALTIVVAVNDDRVLEKNLLLSPHIEIASRHQLLIKKHYTSASVAYNSAIDEAVNDLIIFVHQDVYLPSAWFRDLQRCLEFLERQGVNWGVIGCYGVRGGDSEGLGRVYTHGIGPHGRPLVHPEPIDTLDEIVLIIRRSSGLRFDPALPHFHLYGSDICLTARERGMSNYAFQGFCVHNTNQLLILPDEFYTCYRYIRSKWARYLPIQTSCMRISFLNEEFYRRRIIEAKQRVFGMRTRAAKRAEDPRLLVGDRE